MDNDIESQSTRYITNSCQIDKKFNSYRFIVEKNKIPDKDYKLKKYDPDDICSDFFEEKSSWNEDKIFKILYNSFESKDNCISKAGDTALIEGFRIAYLHHFPIVINPNDLWLVILQGFSNHMQANNNSERIRSKLVNFKNKKEIVIETGINLFMASDEQWNSFIEMLLNKTSEKLKEKGQNLINLFNKKFSTSTREAEIANNVTILSSFKKYFAYTLCGTCGISEIIIEGTIGDWQLLLEKVLEIGKLDDKIIFWTKELKKIINKIIDTLITKKPDLKFYQNIVQIKDNRKECLPDIINGWIVKFIPYDKKGNKINFNSPKFKGLKIDDIPSQITNLSFNLININKKGQSKKYEAEIYTGFFGVKQNQETLAIKPVIGYAIVEVKDKKKEEEKELEKEKYKLKVLEEFRKEEEMKKNNNKSQK